MLDMDVTQELLFQQLGLDSSKEGIEKFIDTHRLDLNTAMPAADFWTDSQSNFLISHWGKDDEWSMVIDQLNEQLHND
ncbi:DUF2789 domain-containing protein [Acinetobacter portensis]|uniref:DUF2789 family protein n=3 Tax=Acinetobacter TaxID=469 RepID=A0A6L6GJA0_9GAMM|nr:MULTISPECIES: DUF2789 family protein [Acinetobacter]MBP7793940.1 DUF2789 family protein [Acinetobacter sp.]MCK7609523.1 DUF2789 domain-containing protein [Acinetobacter portensis]MCK7640325.1 DUF2789 domain-containing protein [Acinetobacter portensis]MDY6459418.1 DUF2789 family protein [Acinetobacter faecalis]MDY6462485.1 DUF2789 family protein [Acinetobacter faecalis]